MTPLRQRTLQELQRRNYSPSTIRGYLSAVSQFAEHFHCSPEQLGPEHLRRYQRCLLQVSARDLCFVDLCPRDLLPRSDLF
jgi:integrase/recombinase XerD